MNQETHNTLTRHPLLLLPILFLLWFGNNNIHAQTTHYAVIDTQIVTSLDLNPHVLIVEDPSLSLHVNDIYSAINTAAMADAGLANTKLPNTKSAYWAVVSLNNTISYPTEWILETAGLDFVDCYLLKDGEELLHQKMGRLVPASQRAILIGHPLENKFQLKLPKAGQYQLFVRYYNSGQMPIEVNLALFTLDAWEKQTLAKEVNRQSVLGFTMGFMVIMLLYNLLLYLFSRDKVYLYYAAYILFPTIYLTTINGVYIHTFLGEFPEGYLYGRSLSPAIALVFYLLFMRYFLNTPKLIGRKKDRIIDYFIWAEIINVVFMTVAILANMPEKTYRLISVGVHAIVLLSIIYYLIILVRTGNRLAQYFVIGASFFILTAIFFSIIILAKILTYDTGVLVQSVGIAGELVTFSLGLGYRIRMIERERVEIEQENARILEAQNQILEDRVLERTSEIEKQKEEILTQNEELHQQQEEIVAQRDYISQQKEVLQLQNEHMTDSIRYAKTIQEAILPLEGRIDQIFDDYFILYRPTDIVSGDFYWLLQVENKVYLAVVDCTGHGVPGAFMSIVGATLLDDIITKEGIYSPAAILEQLNLSIQFLLKQGDNRHTNQDGMDICLCRFENTSMNPDDVKQISVTFSGAKRPLYFFENDSSSVKQLKGDRKSIGGMQRGEKAFTDQTIILEKGAQLYFTTDGYVDQHNMDGKKIGSLKLEELLQDISILPMKEQRQALESFLNQHQGKQKQRDDITLLGVKI